MKTNYEYILQVIEIIESDLSGVHNIETLSEDIGYSKYHLHRMFSNVVGLSVHQYIKRRRLSEAAKLLLCSKKSILEIALESGYQSQQAFTDAFKKTFRISPKWFRFKMRRFTLTPRFEGTESPKLTGKAIDDIRIEKCDEILLQGYQLSSNRIPFFIARLWKKLHREKKTFIHRVSVEWLIALNDYRKMREMNECTNEFDYMAGIQVAEFESREDDSVQKRLCSSSYVVFSFRGRPQDSVEEALQFVYKEWFPSTTYQLNSDAMYDFVRYGENLDERESTNIEIWIPILNAE